MQRRFRSIRLILPLLLLCTAARVFAQTVYYEDPVEFVAADHRYPELLQTDDHTYLIYESVSVLTSGTQVGFEVRSTDDGVTWTDAASLPDTVVLVDPTVPRLYGATIGAGGELAIAILGNESVAVYRSADGQAFRRVGQIPITLTTSNPRLFVMGDGTLAVIAEQRIDGVNRVVMARQDDAGFGEFVALVTDEPSDEVEPEELNQWNPTHLSFGGRDMLVFEREIYVVPDQREEDIPIPTYQLFASYSRDAGTTWSPAEWITDLDTTLDAVRHNNRRPSLAARTGGGVLTWERGRGTDPRQVYYMRFGSSGAVEEVRQVSSEDTAVYVPRYLVSGSTEYILAYSNPGGASRIVLYTRTGLGGEWRGQELTRLGSSTYGTIADIRGKLHAFWQYRDGTDSALPISIVYRGPDQSALPPRVEAVGFTLGTRSRQSQASFRWTAPADRAGVVAYSYSWSQDPGVVPDRVLDDVSAGETLTLTADQDGEWHFSIRSLDRAGNWSEPVSVVYFRDTTPPPRVVFEPPPLDEDGFLVSNTFAISWGPGDDDPIDGYGYELFRVGEVDETFDPSGATIPGLGGRIDTRGTSIARNNIDNGLWGLAVSAVDSVGNVGPASVLLFRANKYIPVTRISWIYQEVDALGRYNIQILGRGFTTPDDTISQIYVDTDRREPYDYVFSRTAGDFVVVSDRMIERFRVENVETGDYFIGVLHPERGVEFSDQLLQFQRGGTIKYGNYIVRRGTEFDLVAPERSLFSGANVIIWVTLVLMAGGILLASYRLVAIGREARLVRLEVRALLAGPSTALPWAEREARLIEMRKRGIGLRVKFAAVFAVLVAVVVASLAMSLAVVTLRNQRESLAQSLQDRTAILIEGMAADVADLVRTRGATIELESRVNRVSAMPGEAYYATITGGPPRPNDWTDPIEVAEYDRLFNVDYVYATSDELVKQQRFPEATPAAAEEAATESSGIDSASRVPFGRSITTIESLVEGYTAVANAQYPGILDLLEDAISDEVATEVERINVEARAQLRVLEREIWDARQRLEDAKVTPEPEDDEEAFDYLEDLRTLRTQYLEEIAGGVRAHPEFNVAEFDPEQSDYLFWYPIVDADPAITNKPLRVATAANPIGEAIELKSEDLDRARYVHGIIRVGVATDVINERVQGATRDIIRITLFVALGAILAGMIGAIGLASIVVRPIKRLVEAVERISDTADKSTLHGETIPIRSRDEIGRLADTVNTMTEGLADAADAAKELTVSSDLQKAFMPLESVGEGRDRRKLTYAHLETDHLEFHGYYEGADALSGDAFNYVRLDGSNFAVMKCDVSGHGVTAAIIMVEVASIFLNHVRDWREKRKPRRLNELLYTVNALVDERDFYARFAAMTVGIINAENGRLTVAHAGDQILPVYRGSEMRVVNREMNKAPAAGFISEDMFPPDTRFVETHETLAAGDILLLPTDGIEESKTLVRESDFSKLYVPPEKREEIEERYRAFCEAQGFTETLKVSKGLTWDEKEELLLEDFNPDRVVEVIQRVQTRGSYRLARFNDPNSSEQLVFDFGSLEPTAESTVLGVMAVEKVFRLTRDPSAGAKDRIRVDANIDRFLRDHFSLYNLYFGHGVSREETDMPERDEYVWFSHLREEEQRDDLTMLAIRKK
jgi:HAMP domain-containing protein